MTDQDLKGLETLREVETEWLADQLTESIANLSYPVGMGEGPTPDHARKAAETLFDRYSQMIAAINARAQAAEAERDALRERVGVLEGALVMARGPLRYAYRNVSSVTSDKVHNEVLPTIDAALSTPDKAGRSGEGE